MPEGRMLKKRICESKSLGTLKNDSARLLYTWLIPWLDIEGRHSADPEIIKGHIFPKVKSMTTSKIINLLEHLNDADLVILYKANSETYLQFTQFTEHQILNPGREAKSKIPPPKAQLQSSPDNSLLIKVKESKSKVKESKDTPLHKKIITYLNEKTKKNFSLSAEKTIEFINGRLGEGFKLDDFKHVIDVKVIDWGDDEKMNKFLRPSTLFRKSNFENYRNEILPKHRPQVGENIHKPTHKDIAYRNDRTIKILEIDKELANEVKKAREAKDIDRLDELENIKKEKIAEFSQEYSAREE